MKTRQGNSLGVREALTDFEDTLQSILNPVRPDPEYVQQLRQRLTTPAAVVLEQHPASWAFLTLIGGLMLGVILVWFIQRNR